MDMSGQTFELGLGLTQQMQALDFRRNETGRFRRSGFRMAI